MPGHPVHFEVTSKDADKSAIPHVGGFACGTDTDGNDFNLFESDETAAR